MNWTETEDNAILSASGYDDYVVVCNRRNIEPRSYDAYRKRVKRLVATSHGLESLQPPVETAERKRPATDEEWEALFGTLEGVAKNRQATYPSQQSTSLTIDEPVIAIAFIGDIHAGADGVDYERLKHDLQVISETDGLYAVGMGDYMENAKTDGKAKTALYSTIMKPSEQSEYIRRRFSVCNGKWLAFIGGNHDAWDYKSGGIDRLPDIADYLEAPYFTERGGSIYVDLGLHTYHIVVKHDYTGKSRINKSNSARRMWHEWAHDWENADVICLAHLHEPDMHHTMAKGRDVVWLRSGTYKNHDGYAESGGFRPEYGVPVVLLYRDSRTIIPLHGLNFDHAIEIFKSERERLAR